MNRRRLILGGLGLVVALAAAWYFASPSWTLYRMRAAAQSGDSEAFAAYVDFPALRENMKGQMKARLQSEAKSERSGLGGLEIALGSVLVGPMVDSIVSPEGVRAA
ncbi:MAG: hypothetical protein JWP15_3456, partial [Alphaproteobacteria bacterium]|nr:hypothetical protein [Alphaproteobacteria bacterium]